jgi:hypothetical protein
MSITPGKPGAPTEVVKVLWTGKEAALEVTRDEGGDNPKRVKVRLPENELSKIWQIVTANELRSFEPNESSGEVFDFGERRFEIAVATSANESMTRHSLSWEKPISNGAKVEPLIREMSRLAAQYGKSVQLYYFPNPDR